MTDVLPALLHVHCSPELLNSLDHQLIFVRRFDDSTNVFLQNQNTISCISWLIHACAIHIQLYSRILHAMPASTRQARIVQLQRARHARACMQFVRYCSYIMKRHVMYMYVTFTDLQLHAKGSQLGWHQDSLVGCATSLLHSPQKSLLLPLRCALDYCPA